MSRTLAFVIGMLLASTASADDYLRGYAQGVVDSRAPNEGIRVTRADGGAVALASKACVGARQLDTLEKTLTENPAIAVVEWNVARCTPAQTLQQAETEAPEDTGALPEGELFETLLADPKQPSFAVHYQAHQLPGGSFNAALATIGDYLPLVRSATAAGQFEFGLEAGVFSLFNLDTDSLNLINSDFIVGFPLSYRLDAFSARAQVYHQSSHLGDEFLLGNPNVERVNLSYEDSELLLAYDLPGFRLYGGGGYIFSAEPKLDPAHWQAGLEFRWPEAVAGLDLVAASDLQSFEELDWDVDQSHRFGLAWRRDTGREIRLMIERYDGFSPNGQFFRTPLRFWGIGLFLDL